MGKELRSWSNPYKRVEMRGGGWRIPEGIKLYEETKRLMNQ